MIDNLRDWWRLRTLREQRLLLAMVALLVVTFAWLVVVRPVDDALADARARHGRAVIAVADARAQGEAIMRLQRAAALPPSLPINIFVSQKAEEAGFAVARLEPEGANQVQLAINAVRAQAFFPWVAQLERRHGLIVERLVARTNSDATLAVQVTFRTRSR